MGSSVIGRELSRDYAPDWLAGPEELPIDDPYLNITVDVFHMLFVQCEKNNVYRLSNLESSKFN